MSSTNKYGELSDAACPKCGDPVKPKWVACPGCGAQLKGGRSAVARDKTKKGGRSAVARDKTKAPTTCPGCLESVGRAERKLRCPKCDHFVHKLCMKERDFKVTRKPSPFFSDIGIGHAGKAICTVCCPVFPVS